MQKNLPITVLGILCVLIIGYAVITAIGYFMWIPTTSVTPAPQPNHISVVPDQGALPQVFRDTNSLFSLRLPVHYVIDTAYIYTSLGPGKDIYGVKFSIDPALAQGTNLSADTYITDLRLIG
jgi:hypothetical protein